MSSITDQKLQSSQPKLVGILNITPDSFSDGGAYADPKAAIAHGLSMIEAGAAVIDVGPESTRPGSDPVPADEQIARAIPVIRGIYERNPNAILSIDTTSAQVARAAVAAGATMVNDTSALRDDPDMVHVVAEGGVDVVLMHRRGTPKDMQKDGGPQYANVVAEIAEFLRERIDYAKSNGIARKQITIDPGLGFGKRPEHNFEILCGLGSLFCLGQPVMLGASRKRFIGLVTGVNDPRARDAGSIAFAVCAAVIAHEGGRHPLLLRVHDVPGTAAAMRVFNEIATRIGHGDNSDHDS